MRKLIVIPPGFLDFERRPKLSLARYLNRLIKEMVF